MVRIANSIYGLVKTMIPCRYEIESQGKMEGFASISHILLSRWNGPGELIMYVCSRVLYCCKVGLILYNPWFINLILSSKAVCGGIEELTDYTLLSKGKKEGKVISQSVKASLPVKL